MLGTEEQARLLLGARFKEGDRVMYPLRHLEGEVTRRWVTADGSIWVTVERSGEEQDLSIHSVSVCESCLIPAKEEPDPSILKFPTRSAQGDTVIVDEKGAPASYVR